MMTFSLLYLFYLFSGHALLELRVIRKQLLYLHKVGVRLCTHYFTHTPLVGLHRVICCYCCYSSEYHVICESPLRITWSRVFGFCLLAEKIVPINIRQKNLEIERVNVMAYIESSYL